MSELWERKPKIYFKEGVNPLDMMFIHHNLGKMLWHIAGFCADHGIEFWVTSMLRTEKENQALKARSKTHVEGRAFDFSIRQEHGWNDLLVQRLTNELSFKFNNEAAISAVTMHPAPIVVHRNHGALGMHAHVQVRR